MANFALSDSMLELTEKALSMCDDDPEKVGEALSSIRLGNTFGWIIAKEQSPEKREADVYKLNRLLSRPDLIHPKNPVYMEEMREMDYPRATRQFVQVMTGEFREVVGAAAALVYEDQYLLALLDSFSAADNQNPAVGDGIKTSEREKFVIKFAREQRRDIDRFESMIRRITTRPRDEVKQAEEGGIKEKDLPPYYAGIPPIFGDKLLTWGPARQRR